MPAVTLARAPGSLRLIARLTLWAVALVLTAAGTLPGDAHAQTTVLVEDFEDATVAYTTSEGEFSDGNADFFTRTDGTNTSFSYQVTGANGSFYFAAQDLDGEGGSAVQSITFSGLDITGLTNLSFSALFAEDDDGTNEDYDASDYVRVFASIDGAPETQVFGIANNGDTFNSAPFIDTDFDGVGDGAEITDTFASFSAAIPGTGSTLALRIEIALDAGDEDIAIDDVMVTGMAPNLPPVVVSAPDSPITVSTGAPISFTVAFTPPESDQSFSSTSIQLNGGITFTDVSCSTTFGPPGDVTSVDCTGSISTAGSYSIDITATDDGSPPLSTTARTELVVVPSPACLMPTFTQAQSGEQITITMNANDPSGLVRADFVDPSDVPFLNNLTVIDSDGFTSSDGIRWAPPSPTPTTATFVLQRTSVDVSTASFFLILENGCGEVRFDPELSFATRAFALEGSYPNPTSAGATMGFTLEEAGPVRLAVYDVMGRKVATLVDQPMAAGRHEVRWNGRSVEGSAVASGVYLIRLEAGDQVATRRLTVVK